jgi:hypothetical protein
MDSAVNAQTGLAPAGKLFGMGADVLGQIERTIGQNKIRAVRVKLGDRTLKEIPIQAASMILTIGVALLAVVVSSLSVEVEHEPAA